MPQKTLFAAVRDLDRAKSLRHCELTCFVGELTLSEAGEGSLGEAFGLVGTTLPTKLFDRIIPQNSLFDWLRALDRAKVPSIDSRRAAGGTTRAVALAVGQRAGTSA